MQMSLLSQSLCPYLPAGRADYYGNLPNLAARVSALAQPGQVLLEGCQGFGDELQWIKEDSLALLQLHHVGAAGGTSVGECIEISYLGQFLLKVGTVYLYCIPAQRVRDLLLGVLPSQGGHSAHLVHLCSRGVDMLCLPSQGGQDCVHLRPPARPCLVSFVMSSLSSKRDFLQSPGPCRARSR